MIGGAFLCFEGFEKLAHKFLHSKEEDEQHHQEILAAIQDPTVDMVAMEKDKIKGAVTTDFILSAEIIVIALGTVATKTLMEQTMVLVTIAIAMTIGVYGLVAAIVKLDDAGLYLSQRGNAALVGVGKLLLLAAPALMKTLAVLGTAAMFMVGGSILAHGIAPVHHFIEQTGQSLPSVLGVVVTSLMDLVVGLVAGAIVLGVVTLVQRLFKKKA
jgi:predicted DNA repair protein MutK